jgi:hypothetical protein
VLKGADYLGLEWYDDAIGFIQQSKYFPELAQASGDFANTIDDLDVLYDASKIGQRSGDSYRVYRLMDGNAREVFGNFSTKYANRPPSGQIPDIIEFGDPSNPTRLILRRSSTDNNLMPVAGRDFLPIDALFDVEWKGAVLRACFPLLPPIRFPGLSRCGVSDGVAPQRAVARIGQPIRGPDAEQSRQPQRVQPGDANAVSECRLVRLFPSPFWPVKKGTSRGTRRAR